MIRTREISPRERKEINEATGQNTYSMRIPTVEITDDTYAYYKLYIQIYGGRENLFDGTKVSVILQFLSRGSLHTSAHASEKNANDEIFTRFKASRTKGERPVSKSRRLIIYKNDAHKGRVCDDLSSRCGYAIRDRSH